MKLSLILGSVALAASATGVAAKGHGNHAGGGDGMVNEEKQMKKKMKKEMRKHKGGSGSKKRTRGSKSSKGGPEPPEADMDLIDCSFVNPALIQANAVEAAIGEYLLEHAMGVNTILNDSLYAYVNGDTSAQELSDAGEAVGEAHGGVFEGMEEEDITALICGFKGIMVSQMEDTCLYPDWGHALMSVVDLLMDGFGYAILGYELECPMEMM